MSKKPRLVRVKEKIKVHQSNIKEISSPEVIKANERLDNLSSEMVDFGIYQTPPPLPTLSPSLQEGRGTSPGKKKNKRFENRRG